MKPIRYLSFSSISKFDEDRDKFYLQYLADTRPPKFPQTIQMAAGSAFDAYVKSFLAKRLFGNSKPEFELDSIFEQQVEPQNRDASKKVGEYLFECYKLSGALADLFLELQKASTEPRFEFQVENRVSHENVLHDVVLLGKPDIFWTNDKGANIVYDFKVNGFYSRSPISPNKGYVMIRDGFTGKPSRGANREHPDCQQSMVDGMSINIAMDLSDIDKSWAEQTSIYSWILGHEVGSKFIVCIDQLVAKPAFEKYPTIRVASYRNRVAKSFQEQYFNRIKRIWEIIQSGHIFDDMTREQSDSRCALLDKQHLAFEDDPEFAMLLGR